MKTILVLLSFVGIAHGATTLSETWQWHVSTEIPDNLAVGLADTRAISTDITQIAGVSVHLVTSGGWNGDLFAYLVHGSGYSVLLNRIGRSASLPDGSGSSGMMVNLSDLAATDIHLAAPDTGEFTGTYQPDGRATDPDNAMDTDARSAMLSSFTGLDANGDWTLFIADLSAGGTATLQSWSLTITAVPEPSAPLLCAFGAITLLRRRRAS